MGHTLTQWQVKVRAIVRAASRREVPTDRIETVGLRPAFMRYSSDRPRRLVREVAGTGSPYVDLPAAWAAGISSLDRVEHPARQVPPTFLDDKAWMLVASVSDVDVEQVLLAVTPSASTFVRLHFSAPWPFPTNDVDVDGNATVDLADDFAFEGVSSLAASYVILGLELDTRRRSANNAAPADAKPAGIPDESLLKTAKAYEDIYLRFLGIDPTTPGTSTVGPVSITVDYDPEADSMFHGGPR